MGGGRFLPPLPLGKEAPIESELVLFRSCLPLGNPLIKILQPIVRGRNSKLDMLRLSQYDPCDGSDDHRIFERELDAIELSNAPIQSAFGVHGEVAFGGRAPVRLPFLNLSGIKDV